MTKDQVAKLRDYNLQDDGTGKPIAEVFSYVFNNEINFINTRDFVITDDDNELIYAVKANNENPVDQARYPFRIVTGFYGNIQYTEALYNMENFKRAVKEQFLDTGLITQDKLDMILDWSKGIRNQACVPKAPGPYYKDTILPVPKPPVPEVRHDGLYHASPIDQITLTKKVHEIVKPLIEASFPGITEKIYNHYEIEMEDISSIPESFLAVIEGFGEDLFMASVANMKFSAPYKMDIQKTKDTFVNRCTTLMPAKPGKTVILTFYIEAYNVRVSYQFKIKWAKEEPEDPSIWINATTTAINNVVDNYDYSEGTEFSRTGTTLNYTISDEVTSDEVSPLINQILAIDGVDTIAYNVGSTSLEYKVGSDISALNTFIEGVINSMPTDANTSANGSVATLSATGVSVTYTLKVKYFNEAECECKVNDTYYNTLAEGCAAAVSGDTITLLKSLVVSNAGIDSLPNNPIYAVNAGVTFDGNNLSITADDDSWVESESAPYGTNHIIGTSSGTTTIKNLTVIGNQKNKSGIVIYGNGTVCTLENVTSQNNGNCGVQVSGATVTATDLNTSDNTWGAVNVDKGSDGSIPAFTFVSGTMAENVEIYTEITDQDVVTAESLTKYQGFGTNLKGFIYYTSDVSRLGFVVDGAVYETLNDVIENGGDTVTLTVPDNMTEEVTIPEGKTVTLNLNGKTITNTNDSATVINNGTLILDGDGTIDNVTNGKAPIENNGTLTILKGTYTRSLDDGQPDVAGTNSYYTIINHGTMVIGQEGGSDSDIVISNPGGYSSLVENGWYDSEGKTAENDTCTLTIYNGTFTGGKYNIKNDELGVIVVNGGVYSQPGDVNVLNWHDMTINGGTYTAIATKANLANGTYGQGIGKVVIHDGDFNAQNVPNISMVNGYASSDITIDGGTFTSRTGLNNYIADGYVINETDEGKFEVVQEDPSVALEESVDAIIESIDYEGMTVEADAETNNTYTIITSTGDISGSGMFDSIAAIENLASITVTDGEGGEATYTAGGDLTAFKAAVDALVPKNNASEEAILSMVVTVN